MWKRTKFTNRLLYLKINDLHFYNDQQGPASLAVKNKSVCVEVYRKTAVDTLDLFPLNTFQVSLWSQ